MRQWKAIYTIWQREIIRYTRDRTRIATTMFQPLMFLAIFGAGFRRTLAASHFGIDFMQFMYPGIIGINVMGVAFHSTISTVWDREFGFLKEILVAPVSRLSIVAGKVLGASTIASLQALILLVLAPFIHVPIRLAMLPEMVFFMLLIALAISGLGILVASLMKSMEGFGLLMQLLIFPMFFMSGAFFPMTAVPVWMKWLARLNPLTYGVDALRRIITGNLIPQQVIDRLVMHSLPINAGFLVGFSILMFALALKAFNKKN